MRIGQKLICGFVGVALLVGVVGYISVNTSQKTLQKTIGENSVILAQETLDKIDRNLYSKIERFQSFQDPSLQETVIKSNQEFEKLDNIQNYIDEKDREWTSVPKEEITRFMKDLINNKLSKELRKRTKFYEEKYGFNIFPEIFVTNKYGANAGQTGKTTDYRQDDEEWWQVAKKDGFYIRDVEYDESADVYSTDIGIRIDDENGNFSGAIKVVLNVKEVINILKEAEAAAEYKTTQFKLLTKDGKLIYSTEDFEFFEDFSNELLSRFREERPEEHLDYFIAEGDKPGEGDELFAHTHSKGYKDYKGLGWILVIEHTTEEIFAPVAQLRNRLVIISLGVAILAVLIGLFISRAFSNPLMKLRDAAIEIGKGNLEDRIEVKSNDEIGELGASFSEIAGKLKESHKQLEVKVQERTAELSSANEKLEEEIAERSSAQRNLQEHIKQLNCFYGLSKLIERPKTPLEQIFQEMPELIRKAYQYPDVTCARITFDGIQYKTDNFEKTELSQYAQINVRGDKVGDIEVYYLGEKAEGGESPFLKGEHNLLDAVAEHLSIMTERRQTGEKLQLFRNLMDRSNDCIFVIEPKWDRFLDVNGTACGSLGYTREELLNMTVKDIDDSVRDDSCWTELAKEIRKEGYMIFESVYKREDGTTFPVEINVAFIEQEKKSYLLAIVRDITERKWAEERQARLMEEIESINKELKDFAYIISHDLKAPLRGVSTLANWISTDYADKLGEEGKEQIDLLLTRVGRMHKLIDGVLQYSRVGRAKEEQIQVNLNELVPEVIEMIAPPENIEITVENELPVVVGEQTRIMQVFQNLLSNAVKYMDRPKGQIKIGCAEENGFWKFSIADNGPGIEEKHFERIFRIFQTLSPRDEYESTGVGLTVVKKIVELYGGKVWVESKPGEGSTFFFTLPKQEMGVKDAKYEANIVSRR